MTPPDLKDRLLKTNWKIAVPSVTLVAFFLAYFGVWYSLASTAEQALQKWQQKEAERGLNAAWSDLSFSGFPYRFTITLDDPTIVDTSNAENWTWRGESLTANAPPYNLRHVIVEAEGQHDISYIEQGDSAPTRINLQTEKFWASHVYKGSGPMGRLAVDLSGARADRFTPEGTPRDRFELDRLQIHGHPSPKHVEVTPEAPILPFDIALQVQNARWLNADLALWPGPEVQLLRLQGRLRNVPTSMMKGRKISLERWLREGGRLAISELILNWGPIDLTGTGELRTDRRGRPAGKLKVSLGNLENLIDALVEADLVNRNDANLAFIGLQALSALQGEDDNRVRATLKFSNGEVKLGPIKIGEVSPLY